MQVGDCIYGTVEITEAAIQDVLAIQVVQRLKGVLQHGISALIGITTPVSRYDHSLGVMLLIRRLGGDEEDDEGEDGGSQVDQAGKQHGNLRPDDDGEIETAVGGQPAALHASPALVLALGHHHAPPYDSEAWEGMVELHRALGAFIALIVVNCLILGRQEAFASKNNPFRSLVDGLGMGLATTFVLVCASLLISLVRKAIPTQVRIASFIVVIATFVTIVDLTMKAKFTAMSKSLGAFIPLIVVNCLILGRQEAFSSKNNPFRSLIDGLGMGIGFTATLVVLGGVRELLVPAVQRDRWPALARLCAGDPQLHLALGLQHRQVGLRFAEIDGIRMVEAMTAGIAVGANTEPCAQSKRV